MKFPLILSLLLLCIWSAAATNPSFTIVVRQENAASRTRTRTNTPDPTTHRSSQSQPTRTPIHTPTNGPTSKPNPKPTGTPQPNSGSNGLSTGAKIGLALGACVFVLGIGGTIAYFIGRRRGQKRRVDDPTAGAGKLIKDPSPELNILPPTPAVAELPTVNSNENMAQPKNNAWWSSMRGMPTKKAAYVQTPNAHQAPQELPSTSSPRPPQELPT